MGKMIYISGLKINKLTELSEYQRNGYFNNYNIGLKLAEKNKLIPFAFAYTHTNNSITDIELFNLNDCSTITLDSGLIEKTDNVFYENSQYYDLYKFTGMIPIQTIFSKGDYLLNITNNFDDFQSEPFRVIGTQIEPVLSYSNYNITPANSYCPQTFVATIDVTNNGDSDVITLTFDWGVYGVQYQSFFIDSGQTLTKTSSINVLTGIGTNYLTISDSLGNSLLMSFDIYEQFSLGFSLGFN